MPLCEGAGELAIADIDDTIGEVYGRGQQGAGFGYTGVRGLNTLLATVAAEAPGASGRQSSVATVPFHRGAARPRSLAVSWALRVGVAAAMSIGPSPAPTH